ncbi:MAG: hypothetical protein ACHQAX_02200 [Gammaproteobacteria bacterium]
MLILFKMARALMSSSMHETPQVALKRLRDSAGPHLKPLFAEDPVTGDNFLHHAAKGKLDERIFETYLDKVGPEAGVAMAKITNNAGRVPLQIASKAFEVSKSNVIPLKLLTLTKKYNATDETFDKAQVLSQYTGKSLSVNVRNNLEIACEVVEKVESYEIKSLTHPSVNNMNEKDFNAMVKKIYGMRELVAKNNAKIIHDTPRASSSDAFMLRQFAHLENEIHHVLEFRVGNCFEYSMLGLFILVHEFNKTCAELYQLKFGDHVFNVIGRDKSKASGCIKEFGEEAVVCDVHSKRVYLASEIPNKMMGWAYASFSPIMRKELRGWTRTSFNPKCHGLKMSFSLSHNSLYPTEPESVETKKPTGPSLRK